MSFHEMISSSNCALVLIDFQPAMSQGVHTYDRKTIVDNVQVLAHTARTIELRIVIGTMAKDSFPGPFLPEVTERIYPDAKVRITANFPFSLLSIQRSRAIRNCRQT
jgi:nicotinamidase-related amidase